MTPRSPARDEHARGLAFLATTVLCYGTLWPLTRVAVQFLSPFWYGAGRFAIAGILLFAFLAATGRLRVPPRGDWPVILSVGGVMIGIYSCFFQSGIQFVEAGRATLLGYTVPLWTLPLSVIILGERPSRRRLAGFAVAMAGLAVLFNPFSFDWGDRDVLIGNGLLMLAALIWAPVVIHLRQSRNTLSALQLAPWQVLVACLIFTIGGLIFDGAPTLVWTSDAIAVFAYAGIIGTGIGFYGVNQAIRLLPTVTSTIGLLAVPVFALIVSLVFLDEVLTWALGLGLCLVLTGVALVSAPQREG